MKLGEIFSKHFDIELFPKVYDTIAFTETGLIKQVNEEINSECLKELKKILKGFKIVASIFFIKKPGEDSHLSLHIDTSLTIEPYNAMGIWIPLCDIDEATGRFCLLENSNYFLPPYNTPSMPCPYSQVEDMLNPYLRCISMKAGDALIMDNSIVHCTQKNISQKTRIAVVIKIIDQSAPLVTTYYDESAEDGRKVKLYKQDEDFFTTENFRLPTPPASAEFMSYVPGLPKLFQKEEILGLIDKHNPLTYGVN